MKKALALMMALVLATMLGACSLGLGKVKIVGTWENTKTVLGADVTTTYIFNADGTGTVKTPLGIDAGFTYTLTDDVLEIKMTALEAIGVSSGKYTVSFSGNKMYMTTDTLGLTVEYTKK